MDSNINPDNSCADIIVTDLRLGNPIGEMFKHQQELQQRLGALPKPGDTLTDVACGIIYWEHCINDELEELIEWLTVPGRLDLPELVRVKEIHMECIDVVHFTFNVALYLGFTSSDLTVMFANHESDPDYTGDVMNITNLQTISAEIRETLLQLVRKLPWKRWKTYSSELTIEQMRGATRHTYDKLIGHVLDLADAVGLSRQGLINMYMAKNKENHSRQDRGY